MQSQDPTQLARCQDILAIPAKKQTHPAVHHLTAEQTRRLLAQPDRSTRQGRRDATLLATLYDTGARVQELADLAVRDIRLEPPAIAALTGKGRKSRHVPLTGNTAALLHAYLAEHHLNRPGHDDHPLFVNQHGSKLSRGGIAWIIRKYQANTDELTLANVDISPHTLRHSKAMHLYEAGIPLPYIRDILGHVDLSTTEIYARASTEAGAAASVAHARGGDWTPGVSHMPMTTESREPETPASDWAEPVMETHARASGAQSSAVVFAGMPALAHPPTAGRRGTRP
jgi:integrase/recombinase XerD